MSISKTGQDDADQAPIPNNQPIEPKATQLVLLIQNGINEDENKKLLAGLLYDFARKIAFRVMNSDIFSKEDKEDAAISYIEDRILKAKREGYKGKNNHHYENPLYRFKPEFKSDRIDAKGGSTFSGFIGNAMMWKFKYQEENDKEQEQEQEQKQEQKQEQEQKRNTETETEVVSFDILPEHVTATNPETERVNKQREIAIREIVNALALLYKDFFDHVNALDENSTKQRAVHERGIISYHVIFAIEKISSKNLLIKGSMRDTFHDKLIKRRPTSFRSFAQEKFSCPLEEIIGFQEKDYQLVLLSKLDFLSRLSERVDRKGIADEPWLSSEADINNKAHGWAKTIERRVESEYSAFVANCDKQREVFINGLF
jgi:hypothetical protein